MNENPNPYQSWGMVAANAETDTRASFIRLTYLHLAGAVLAFIGLEAVLLNMPFTNDLVRGMTSGPYSWLIVLGAFMFVSWIASSWAQSATSLTTQYFGLGLYVVAEAIIFVPLLYIAERFGPPQTIETAAILTAIIFGGLTAVVLMTGANFSFLRTGLGIAGFAALAIIAASAICGFSLGLLFIAAMLVLSAGYVLYHTSQVLHEYRIGQHVAASLALFASVALLFWYMIQLVMSLQSRD